MCGISCHNNTKFLHAIAEVCLYLMHNEPSGSRGTPNVPLSQVLTEGPHSPDSLPTENTLGSNNTRHPLWGVSNYTDKTQRQDLKV